MDNLKCLLWSLILMIGVGLSSLAFASSTGVVIKAQAGTSINYVRTNGDSGSLTFTFTVTNQMSSHSIYLYAPTVKSSNNNIPSLNLSSTNCTGVRPANSSCTIIYTAPIPNVSGLSSSIVYSNTFTIKDGFGGITASPLFSITLNPSGQIGGHLEFRNAAGTAITTFNMVPSDNDTMTLHNTGSKPVTGLNLDFSNSIVQNYFSGDCLSTTNLAAGANCQLNYTIPDMPVSDNSTLEATASGADNSPLNLPLNISSNDNWKAANVGLTSTNLSVGSIAVVANNLYIGINTSGVFKITEGESNWTAVSTLAAGVRVVSLAASGSTLYAGTLANGMFKSTNGGDSWTQINNGLTNLQVFSFLVDGNTLYVGTRGGGIFKSTNGGTSWTPINNGLTNLNVDAILADGSNLYVGTLSGVFKSTDSGVNWSASGLAGKSVDGFAHIGNNLYASVYDSTAGIGVYKSTDGGASWQAFNTGVTDNRALTIMSVGSDLYLGTAAGLFRSVNQVNNWQAYNSGLTNTNILTLANKGDRIYVGTNGGGFFWRKPTS